MLAHFPPDVIRPQADTDPARIAALALIALGTSCTAVAQSLTAAGITGVMTAVDACPIARYLTVSDSRLSRVVVGRTEVRINWAAGYAVIGLPSPVAAFVTRFDTGDYLHLIAPPQPSHPADPGTTARSEDHL